MRNNYCDGGNECVDGEVRVLPVGKDSNRILCFACFRAEMAWRMERNKTLAVWAKFPLLAWKDLEVCNGGE